MLESLPHLSQPTGGISRNPNGRSCTSQHSRAQLLPSPFSLERSPVRPFLPPILQTRSCQGRRWPPRGHAHRPVLSHPLTSAALTPCHEATSAPASPRSPASAGEPVSGSLLSPFTVLTPQTSPQTSLATLPSLPQGPSRVSQMASLRQQLLRGRLQLPQLPPPCCTPHPSFRSSAQLLFFTPSRSKPAPSAVFASQ